MIVALVNQKGGVSKSTTAGHLVYWLKQREKRVALIDADVQQSSSIWVKSWEQDVPIWVLQSSDEVLDKTPDIAAVHDFTIIDGPAGLSELTRSILLRCDVAILPCQPSGFDIRSASDAVKLVKQAQSVRGGKPAAAIFLSRAIKGTKLKEEAIAVLEKLGLPILETAIHQRQVVADCFGQQCTVWEMGSRAATDSGNEFAQLFKEVLTL